MKTNDRTILIAEDEEGVRKNIAEYLTLSCKNVYEAKDGLEILKEIHSINPQAKVIILSGQEDGNLVYDFVRENATNYVVKDNNAFANVKNAIVDIIKNI